MLARVLVPPPIRRALRSAHRDLTFRRTCARLTRDPVGVARDVTALSDLIYGWGNAGFSALHEYLQHMAVTANELTVEGDILECGSGLSTLVLAAVAQRTGRQVITLEHIPSWAARVRTALSRAGLQDAATVLDVPLVARGEDEWYGYTPDRPFALVICDGPPSTTKGGRYGMLPAVASHLVPGAIILLDDLERPDEQAIFARWTRETGGQSAVLGVAKPFGTLRLPMHGRSQ